MEKKYDVFISCKSEDYGYAEEVYNFLNSNGIRTFLASKELRKMGDAEYRNAIMHALESAYHLIVFASNPEYIESKWVFYEWDTFVNAKLSGRKDGQIMTILKGVSNKELRLDLLKYESFTFENYKERLLSYVETPESRRIKEEQRHKEDLFRQQAAIEAQKRIEEEKQARIREEEYNRVLTESQKKEADTSSGYSTRIVKNAIWGQIIGLGIIACIFVGLLFAGVTKTRKAIMMEDILLVTTLGGMIWSTFQIKKYTWCKWSFLVLDAIALMLLYRICTNYYDIGYSTKNMSFVFRNIRHVGYCCKYNASLVYTILGSTYILHNLCILAIMHSRTLWNKFHVSFEKS